MKESRSKRQRTYSESRLNLSELAQETQAFTGHKLYNPALVTTGSIPFLELPISVYS